MEDRRAAYPTKDTPDMPPDAGRSAIDSPVMRAENDSIHNVHRRYWMLLVIGVVCVGLYSFYAPVSMTSALHCANGQNVSFSYLILEEDCISAAALPARAEALPLNAEAEAVLTARSASHMLQQDAVFEGGAIVVYPSENTNYALYVSESGSYVFAEDDSKFRFQVKDDSGDLYSLLSAAL